MNYFRNNFADIDASTTIFWFRRDLRLDDNAGLYYALKENKEVLPLFIFDSTILDSLENLHDSRVEFIHKSLQTLQTELESVNSSLLILHGNPAEIFKKLNPKAVYANHDYEPYGRKRDDAIRTILRNNKIPFNTYKDQVIFEKGEVVKGDGTPYTVFTPYSKKWKAALNSYFLKSYPVKNYFTHFKKSKPLYFPSLADLNFKPSGIQFPERNIKKGIIENYHINRDYPGMESTSRLSVHLRFGTVSIRKVVRYAQKINPTWLNEFIWRDFYHMILWHFPHVETKAFKPAYDRIAWRNNPDEFTSWCKGQTGYPIVDAGMRELNATGFMHNRVRMIVASFLTKHLLIDWRWGEAYFSNHLLDFDLAANNGGWQWAAGSGCDAAPYFRVFNPYIQTKKFDPKNTYIKKWVPEFESPEYPKPIVDHSFARGRVLRVYKEALSP
ncbi:MAG: DNA photolyase family protein [Cyclobacteriaceae bacterium]|nr:DNA photolyase family protein [Cyclobacteriaceae bacterium]